MLYVEADSPLRYRINRLGGRSQQEKWILQAELFNEIHRWVAADWKKLQKQATPRTLVNRLYEVVRDFLKAAEKVWGEAWGNAQLHGHQAGHAQGDAARLRRSGPRRRRAGDGRQKRWERKLAAVDRGARRRSATKGSTSASRPRARSNASPASTASSAAWPASPRSAARPAPGEE